MYVRAFPDGREKWQVSTHGGFMAHWRRDGKELFYVALDGALMAVDVSIAGAFGAGAPRRLFDAGLTFVPQNKTWMNQYAVARDGQRFLINRSIPESAPAAITAVIAR